MNPRYFSVRLALGAMVCGSIAAVASLPQAPTGEELVVTVGGERIDESSSVTTQVFDREDLEKKAGRTLGDFLKTQTGFQVSTNYQGIASATLRGLPAGNLVVYWNGIRLNDPLDPTTSFDFSRLRLSAVQKIEIVRGPEAGVWGSGATGAVIFVTTEAAPSIGVSGEVGASVATYETYRGDGWLGVNGDRAETLVSANVSSTKGISSADRDLENTERDGRDDEQGLLFHRIRLNDRWRISTLLLAAHSRNDADLRGGVGGDEFGAEDSQATVAASLLLDYSAKDDALKNNTAVSYQNDHRYHVNSVEYARYRSDYASVADTVNWKIDTDNSLTFAAEAEFEKGKSDESTGFASGRRQAVSLRSTYTANLGALNFKTGGRIEIGSESYRTPAWAFFVNPSYRLVRTATTFSAAAGHSFKRASLYQLYSNYGSENLAPEAVWSYEVSALQDIAALRSYALVTFFSNHSTETIDFDLAKMKYFNNGRQENHGVEAALESQLSEKLKSRLEYTWTHSDTLRVAEHKAAASLEVELFRSVTWTHELQYLGERSDIDPINFARVRMPAYILYNSQLDYQIVENLRARFRVDNLLDKRYEEINGFGSPGRYAELGLKYSF